MFNFMKKDKSASAAEAVEKDEKERKRREKKKKHSQHLEGSKMTSDELQRLDEVRKSLRKVTGKLHKKDKLPSGIIADYRDTFDANNAENYNLSPVSESSSTHSSYSNVSGVITRPTSLPAARPASRGILKGQNYNAPVSRSMSAELDDQSILLKNTQANEYLYDQLTQSPKKSPRAPSPPLLDEASADREVSYESVPPTIKVRAYADHVSPVHQSSPQKLLPALTVGELRVLLTGENIGLHQRPLSTEFAIQLPNVKSIPELWDLGNRVLNKDQNDMSKTKEGAGGIKRSDSKRFKIHK
eukprot:maker-scaffold81_size397536-snap-gene-1.17 protein:Tk08532 transcript:maker-scaffold81_size397536-snap-gene-1.17-mRNA-1 annotation:"unconventional myosin-xviiia-like"